MEPISSELSSFEEATLDEVYIYSDGDTNLSPEPQFTSSPLPVRAPEVVHPIPVVCPVGMLGRGPHSTDWCFTCNNPTQQDFTAFDNAVLSGKCTYCCYGKEHFTAPADGTQVTPHL